MAICGKILYMVMVWQFTHKLVGIASIAIFYMVNTKGVSKHSYFSLISAVTHVIGNITCRVQLDFAFNAEIQFWATINFICIFYVITIIEILLGDAVFTRIVNFPNSLNIRYESSERDRCKNIFHSCTSANIFSILYGN